MDQQLIILSSCSNTGCPCYVPMYQHHCTRQLPRLRRLQTPLSLGPSFLACSLVSSNVEGSGDFKFWPECQCHLPRNCSNVQLPCRLSPLQYHCRGEIASCAGSTGIILPTGILQHRHTHSAGAPQCSAGSGVTGGVLALTVVADSGACLEKGDGDCNGRQHGGTAHYCVMLSSKE